MRKEKKSCAEVAKLYGKNEPIHEFGQKEKEIHTSFTVVLKTASQGHSA